MATDEVDEEGDGGVEYFFFVVDEAGRFVDEGEDADGGLEDLEDSKAHCDYMIFLNITPTCIFIILPLLLFPLVPCVLGLRRGVAIL